MIYMLLLLLLVSLIPDCGLNEYLFDKTID